MTTSAIEYKDLYLPVKDQNLLQFIIAMGCRLDALKGDDFRWLAHAGLAWMQEYQTMAPGVRDIELDPWLTTPGRLTMFRKYLHFLAEAPAAGDYDEAAVQEVARRLLAGLDVQGAAP